MKLCIVSWDYPNEGSTAFQFVKELAVNIARLGHEICVIAPYSVMRYRRFYKFRSVDDGVLVLRPPFISFSNLRVADINLSAFMHKTAVLWAMKYIPWKPDAIYGHFWGSAYEAYPYAIRNNIPLFVATGESEILFRNHSRETQEFCKYVRGVICVSTNNMNDSIQLGLTDSSRCIVLPNSIDSSIFKSMDKGECRNRLNVPESKFIISFVGHFNHRKGVTRVLDAVRMTRERDISVVLIGTGPKQQSDIDILFQGSLPHDKVPIYLNMSDVFVLPTLREGCCNAIVEAMACGLPVISSDRPFNYDVLDETNSIMIDPEDINALSMAILKLKNDEELRSRLSEGALKKAACLNISNRAERVVDFISSRL